MKAKKKIKDMKNYGKVKDFIRSIAKNSNDYDEKDMKIKFNSDYEFPPNKIIKIHRIIIVVRTVFHENNKYYLQVF